MDLYKIRNDLNMGIPITNMKLKVTDYARVSTEDIKQKKSLQNQIEHFDEFIKKNANWTYVNGYVDDGITGTSDTKREQFMQMIKDAKEGKFDLIITKEISRFSRNTLDSIKYTRKLLNYGVAVLFINDNINTAMPDSELRLTIMASMAQDEIRRLSERVKFGMNRAIEKGEILGNDLFYGYKKNRETGNLIVLEKEADIVRRLYNLYAVEKYTLNKIAKIFNEEGIKTKKGNKWCTSTLSRMLSNPKYKGYYCGNKTKVEDFITKKIKHLKQDEWKLYKDNKRIPPIVGEELWQRANTRLNIRKQAQSNRTSNKEIYINRYLYSAKIFCNSHNKVFHRRKFRKNIDDYSWVCSEYLLNGKNKCDSPNIRESELDTILKNIINTLFYNKDEITKILLSLYKKYEVENGFLENIKKLEEETNIINHKKEKLLELNIEDKITNAEFYTRNNKLNNELKTTLLNISKLERQKKEFDFTKNKLTKLVELIKKKLNKDNINKLIIKLLLEKIVVSKTNNNIALSIFLNLEKTNKFKSLKNIKYSFKRGYDTICTTRYIVKYKVNCYF